jgi:hypothetical protein
MLTAALEIRSDYVKRLNLAGTVAIAEIVGTVGIIVSLVFVAVGIRSNTAEVRASQVNTIYEGARQIEMSVAGDPEWVDIVIRGRSQTAQLSEAEQWRYDKLLARAADGLMDDDELRGWDAYFDDWARRYLSGSDWQRIRWQFPTGTTLVEKVDAAIMGPPPAADSH